MIPERTLLQRAPSWYIGAWAVLAALVVLISFTRPWYLGIGVVVGFAVVSWMVGRRILGRAVWLTPDEVLVVNTTETIGVPRLHTSVEVVDADGSQLFTNRASPGWDNTLRSRRLLYLTHRGVANERVQVEAALGLTPRRFEELVEALEHAVTA